MVDKYMCLIDNLNEYLPESYEIVMILDSNQDIIVMTDNFKELIPSEIIGIGINFFEILPYINVVDKNRIIRVMNKMNGDDTFRCIEISISVNDYKYFLNLKMRKINENIEGLFVLIMHYAYKVNNVYQNIYIDSLTKANTREYLNYKILSRYNGTEDNSEVSLLMIDVRNMQVINDTYGFIFGDDVIKEVFNIVKKLSAKESSVVRLGGDKAAVLIDSEHGIDQAITIVNMLKCELSKEILVNDLNIKIDFNAGISSYPILIDQLDQLLESAEIALQINKGLNDNLYCIYNEDGYDSIRRRSEIYNALSRAIEEGELSIYLQPLYQADNSKVYGAEVLLRWISKVFGPIPPSVFIPLAEESEMIHKIGNWVIEETLLYIEKWSLQESSFIFSINVSPVQITDENFHNNLILVTKKYGVNPNIIQIELTESVFIDDYAIIHGILEKLKREGFRLAMDDFGTGYSSLNYLRRLPIDVIKIDKTFTNQLVTNDIDRAIAKTIVELAHLLNMEVIAEGIELKEQLEILLSIGCNKIQGYLIDKPIETNLFFEKYLKNERV